MVQTCWDLVSQKCSLITELAIWLTRISCISPFQQLLFPGEPGLTSCRLGFPCVFILRQCILLGQIQTLHILLDTVPPILLWVISRGPRSSFISIHCHTPFHPTCIVLIFNMSLDLFQEDALSQNKYTSPNSPISAFFVFLLNNTSIEA